MSAVRARPHSSPESVHDARTGARAQRGQAGPRQPGAVEGIGRDPAAVISADEDGAQLRGSVLPGAAMTSVSRAPVGTSTTGASIACPTA